MTLTEYDETYGVPGRLRAAVADEHPRRSRQRRRATQLRIAETEKYPHVTFFFNGGVETPFPGEDRHDHPVSPKDVPTYDFKPQMSAPEVTAKVVEPLPNYDLVILNFANPDMVGHTGVVEAGIKAVETIDDCVRQVVESTLALGGQLLITADHGNCEQMRNPDGSPNTAHTTNLVHFIYVGADAGEVSRSRRHPRRRRADPAAPARPAAAAGDDRPFPARAECGLTAEANPLSTFVFLSRSDTCQGPRLRAHFRALPDGVMVAQATLTRFV